MHTLLHEIGHNRHVLSQHARPPPHTRDTTLSLHRTPPHDLATLGMLHGRKGRLGVNLQGESGHTQLLHHVTTVSYFVGLVSHVATETSVSDPVSRLVKEYSRQPRSAG